MLWDDLFNYSIVNLGLKLLFLIAAGMMLVYSVIVVRQISIMKNTVETSYSSLITAVGIINLLLAIGLVVIFLFIL